MKMIDDLNQDVKNCRKEIEVFKKYCKIPGGPTVSSSWGAGRQAGPGAQSQAWGRAQPCSAGLVPVGCSCEQEAKEGK